MSQMNRIPESLKNQSRNDIPRELAELGQLIVTLPNAQKHELEVAFQRAVDSAHRRRRTLEVVQDALSQLRLDIKYLMFDIDATRRERDQLRQKMEE